MLTGSMGMLPSASLGSLNENTKKRNAMYEPVHGSAPDISGKGIANPIAEIASFAMALRYSFNRPFEANLIESSISSALDRNIRTPDIMQDGMEKIGTSAMADAIIQEMNSRIK
jgi:3-isopropylmalate dehydrogenase